MSVLFIIEWDRRRDRSHWKTYYLWRSAGSRSSLCWPTTSLCWPTATIVPLHCQFLPLQDLQCCQAALITQETELENSNLKVHHKNRSFRGLQPSFCAPAPSWEWSPTLSRGPRPGDWCQLGRPGAPGQVHACQSHQCLCCCQRRCSPPSWWTLFPSSSLVSSIHTHPTLTHREHSEMGETHKDHWVQFLSECPIRGHKRCQSIWGFRWTENTTLFLLSVSFCCND